MRVYIEANDFYLNDKFEFTANKYVWYAMTPDSTSVGFKTPSNKYLAVVGGQLKL